MKIHVLTHSESKDIGKRGLENSFIFIDEVHSFLQTKYDNDIFVQSKGTICLSGSLGSQFGINQIAEEVNWDKRIKVSTT